MDVTISGWGVFTGLIAGIIVQATVNGVQELWKRRETRNHLKTEIDLNVARLKELKSVFGKLKDAVNAERIDTFNEYPSVSSMLTIAAFAYVNSGLAYKKLQNDDIAALQRFVNLFTPSVQQQLDARTQTLRDNFDRKNGFDLAMLWEQQIDLHTKALTTVRQKL